MFQQPKDLFYVEILCICERLRYLNAFSTFFELNFHSFVFISKIPIWQISDLPEPIFFRHFFGNME